jgi:hypothetical protein
MTRVFKYPGTRGMVDNGRRLKSNDKIILECECQSMLKKLICYYLHKFHMNDLKLQL